MKPHNTVRCFEYDCKTDQAPEIEVHAKFEDLNAPKHTDMDHTAQLQFISSVEEIPTSRDPLGGGLFFLSSTSTVFQVSDLVITFLRMLKTNWLSVYHAILLGNNIENLIPRTQCIKCAVLAYLWFIQFGHQTAFYRVI